jgi:hypothetical protein
MRLANIRHIYPRKHLTQLEDRQYIYLHKSFFRKIRKIIRDLPWSDFYYDTLLRLPLN